MESREAFAAIERLYRAYNSDSKEMKTRFYYKNRLTDLLKHWNIINQFHISSLNTLKDDDLTLYQTNYATIEKYFMHLRDRFELRQYEMEKPDKQEANNDTINGATAYLTPKMKLKAIEIPKFDGKLECWRNFNQYFLSLVHNNSNMSDIEKFHYLIQSVTGDAAKLVRQIDFSGPNYDAAWNKLTDKYQSNRALVNTYVKQLIGSVVTEPTSKSLERLLNAIEEAKISLESLQQPVGEWNTILVYILESKLDSDTRSHWEESIKESNEIPQLANLLQFLRQRIRILDATGKAKASKADPKSKSSVASTKAGRKVHNNQYTKSNKQCLDCKSEHTLFQCDEFSSKGVPDRKQLVKDNQLCFNCLRKGHSRSACKSTFRCKECRGQHHTLLHEPQDKAATDAQEAPAVPSHSISVCARDQFPITLLPTARVIIQVNGRKLIVRALIDQGSQLNFITQSVANRLHMKPNRIDMVVEGVGGNSTTTHGKVNFTIHSIYNHNKSINVEAIVMRNIISELPSTTVLGQPQIKQDLDLADPSYDQPGKIDVLLGAGVFASILQTGLILAQPGLPMAQETIFGWILSGDTQGVKPKSVAATIRILDNPRSSIDELNQTLKRFWELEEELSVQNPFNLEEQECETEYSKSYKRHPDGRFIVQLPLRECPSKLGDSYDQALRRFRSLERRFKSDPDFKTKYSAVIQEYFDEGHIEQVPEDQLSYKPSFYIPHHAVLKESSLTTKLRVVFDASAKTTTGISLNDIMKVGPVVQSDLYSLIMAWRVPKYVFTADIKGMYRQIWLEKDQWDLQRILWRTDEQHAIGTYRLKTVTFGTASAPYLATRTLKQLAIDSKDKYPIGSKFLENNFYVDDLLGGGPTIQDCIHARDQIITTLKEAGFEIRKWSSNSHQLLRDLPDDVIQTDPRIWLSSETSDVKTLGIHWDPRKDQFKFISYIFNDNHFTKRSIASEAGKIFDPIGWLSPLTVVAKMIIQELWLLNLNWDDQVPTYLKERWIKFRNDISSCDELTIPRWLNLSSCNKHVQIHAFCDASESAYGACIYIRTLIDDIPSVVLITAKTKVAPIKKISIPRLELCAATLLSRLLIKVHNIMPISNYDVFAWTDSSIVLDWLEQSPRKWKTYVANRVSEIHDNQLITLWKHVPTASNPADLASRGLKAKRLKDSKLWWNGPEWLLKDMSEWPKRKERMSTTLEMKKQLSSLSAVPVDDFLLTKYSDLRRLLTISAYCRRMKHRQSEKHITPWELEFEQQFWISKIQNQHYRAEIEALRSQRPISSKSKLLSLTPFVDSDGLLRVGGRLKHAEVDEFRKHSIILPSDNVLTSLIIQKAHLDTLHGGTQLTLSHLRNKFWILKGRQTVKKHISQCLICFRLMQHQNNQLMGNLPKERITISKPFSSTGVDYAGPIDVRKHKGRGSTTYKTYIALFICLSTKAIHLELVTDLTADSLVAAIRRFIARRGHCTQMYSDNGTNMVGASRQLREFKACVQDQHKNIQHQLATLHINWNFIPPKAPHFGGLWENGVKATKHHLKRILGNQTFTLEEMMTALCQIEACLNSRPLYKLSDDPSDLEVLTPNHFLTGQTAVRVPDHHPHSKGMLLQRWNLVQERVHQFWQHWSKDYLATLINRSKWKMAQPNLEVGQLVLIKDDLLSPINWPRGIITDLHPGEDNKVRVVTMKTSSGKLTRPIIKVCPLPLQEPNQKTDNESTRSKETTNTGNNVTVTAKCQLKSNPMRYWYTILSFFCIMSTVTPITQPFNITKFEKNTGIFYESLFHLKLQSDEWTIFSFYNLSNLDNTILTIKLSIHDLQTMCQLSNNIKLCQPLISQSKMASIDLINKQQLLAHHHQNLNKRIKRGLINAVGSIANSLFGVLDDDFAKRYHQDLKIIQENADHQAVLLRNMTSIVDMAVSEIKHQESKMTDFAAQVNNQMLHIRQHVNNMTHELEIATGLLSILHLLTVQIWECHRIQDLLLSAIINSQHGVISTQLMPISTFQQQISLIHKTLGFGKQILFEDEMDWVDLYKTITIQSTVYDNIAMFQLKLPIVDSETFNLYQMHSLPTKMKDLYVYIQPSMKYLVVNDRHDRYFGLTNEDFSQCLQSEELYICKRLGPIFNTNSNELKCELNTFLHQQIDHQHCKLYQRPPAPLWVPLRQTGRWLYVLDEKYHVKIQCPEVSNVFHAILETEGILSLDDSCSVIHKSFLINVPSKKTGGTMINQLVIPQWNLSEVLGDIQQAESIILTPLTWRQSNISYIQTALSSVKEQQWLYKSLDEHNTIQTYVIILILVATTLISITFALVKYNPLCKLLVCKKQMKSIDKLATGIEPSNTNPSVSDDRESLTSLRIL